jgi:methylglutaconyl-CoA hydratase
MPGLRSERDGDVLRITLAKPERRNAFDAALIAELHEAFSDVGDARVVVLGGDGPSFCAGANVEDALRLYEMMAAVDACPAPLVARVQGFALGGGSGLVACSDIVVAAPDATFGFTEVRLGIIPAVISPFVFAKIGTAAARRFFLTGERFDAPTAQRIGLVEEVADDPDAAVERFVGEILKSGPEAARAAKRLAREHPSDGAELARIAARFRSSEEGQEGLRAFLDKRKAGWLR